MVRLRAVLARVRLLPDIGSGRGGPSSPELPAVTHAGFTSKRPAGGRRRASGTARAYTLGMNAGDVAQAPELSRWRQVAAALSRPTASDAEEQLAPVMESLVA